MPYAASRWKHGGVEYPLDDATEHSLLQDADPALYYAIQLFESALNTYVGPRLLAQALLEELRFPSAVAKTLHFEPTPFLLSDQMVFPLFCIWRSEEAWVEKTISFSGDGSTWEWAYVLPPMTPRQIEQLHPILRSVSVVVSSFAQQSFDPEHEDGQTLRDLSGIQQMRAGSVRYGNFEAIDNNDRWWKALTGKLQVFERTSIVEEAFVAFEGVTTHLDATEPDGTQVLDLVVVEDGPAPTVESIAPAAGTKAGGTPAIVTGTGFRVGTTPRVLIGGAYASSVVVVHPTELHCLTPEHEAHPTYLAGVQVIAADGAESNVLEEAFTFTTP